METASYDLPKPVGKARRCESLRLNIAVSLICGMFQEQLATVVDGDEYRWRALRTDFHG